MENLILLQKRLDMHIEDKKQINFKILKFANKHMNPIDSFNSFAYIEKNMNKLDNEKKLELMHMLIIKKTLSKQIDSVLYKMDLIYKNNI